jgi:hypothetical protein
MKKNRITKLGALKLYPRKLCDAKVRMHSTIILLNNSDTGGIIYLDNLFSEGIIYLDNLFSLNIIFLNNYFRLSIAFKCV